VIKYALRTQLPSSNGQSIIAAQDKLRGSIHLDHSAVALDDNYSGGDLIECPQRSRRFPTQLAQFGMQSGRIAERIEQLTKRCGCPRRKQLLIDSPMSAEEDREGGTIDEPGP
jgi:hypothetical protein